jgi:hypothetical protein
MKKQFRFLWLIALLMILSLSCTTITRWFSESGSQPIAPQVTIDAATIEFDEPEQEPLQDPSPEDSVEATEARRLELPPTPTPLSLSSEDDPRQVLDLAEPSYVDYFDNPVTWWDYDTEGRASYQFSDGQLVGVDYEPEERFTWWSYHERQSGNLYAEISTTNGDCIAKDAVGFVIRVDPETAAGGYGVEVSCDGNWRFLKFSQGKQAQVMVEWTEADEINTGLEATNRLGLWAYANEFIIFINGQEVGQLLDRNYSYSFGTFAVYVRASQTFDLTASFDDFAFWHISYLEE